MKTIGKTVFLSSLIALAALAKSGKRAQTKQAFVSYKKCRENVLKTAQKLGAKERKTELTKCDNGYPSAALFRECKQRVLQKFKKNRDKARSKLASCVKISETLQYNPSDLLPLRQFGTRTFYLGIDLKSPTPKAAIEDLANFNCQNILDKTSGSEYLLFGNDYRIFPPLRKKTLKDFVASGAKKKQDYLSVKSFGRIYLKGADRNLTFFPAKHCFFKAEPGQNFADHKIYYLHTSKTLLPYFAISFFRDKKVKLPTLLKYFAKRFGSKFSQIKTKSTTSLYVPKKPKSLDSEKDPKNLCLKNNEYDLIGYISHKGSWVNYAVVANIRNACRFGEQLAKVLKF